MALPKAHFSYLHHPTALALMANCGRLYLSFHTLYYFSTVSAGGPVHRSLPIHANTCSCLFFPSKSSFAGGNEIVGFVRGDDPVGSNLLGRTLPWSV